MGLNIAVVELRKNVMVIVLSTRNTIIPLDAEVCNNVIGTYVIAIVNLKYKNIFNCSSIVDSNGGGTD